MTHDPLSIFAMKTVSKILCSATLLLGLACGGGHGHSHGHGHGHGHGDAKPPAEVTLPPEVITQHGIEVAEVGKRTLQPSFTAPARVTFDEETMAHVGTLVKGRVAEMKAHLGSEVKAGQLLFAIDSPELGAAQNQFLQALDAAAAAEPAVALAENDPGLAKAAADVKAAEAMLALANNPAAINLAKADLAAAEASVELAKNSKAINKAQADLAAAQAMVELAKKSSAVAQVKGKLEAAKPVLARAKELYKIGKKLSEDGAIAIAELKRRETAMQSAAADVLTAQAAVAQAEAQQQRDLKAATAGETAAQAALEQARAQQQGDLKAAEAGRVAATAAVTQASATQQRDLEAAKGKLAAAQAAVTAAKARKKKAVIAAKSALSAAQAAVNTARNQLGLYGMDAAAIAALAKDRKLAPRYVVNAPRAGTVVEREVTAGETVGPDQPHLLILADLSRVWVLIEVPPSRARGLAEKQPVTLTKPDDEYQTPAELAFVSPVVDPKSRTVQARVELANAKGQWRPGQYLTAVLPTGEPATEQLALPAEAVQVVDGQPTVYLRVKEEKGAQTFKPVEVAVGATVDGWRPVLKGLKGGEPVVVKGSYLLKAEFGKAGAGHDHSH